MKKLFGILMIVGLMMACGTSQKPEQAETVEEQAVEVNVGNFEEKAVDLVGKLITIKGTADHICKHDGKKLFLIDVDMPGSVKVVTGEEMPAFNSELEGFDFIVTGIVAETIVDEAYLQEWEEELRTEEEPEAKHLGGNHGHGDGEAEAGEEGEEDDHHSSDAAYETIANYRQMMMDQGIDHLSFYHIVAVSYEVIEE